jgi:hypothetical protein
VAQHSLPNNELCHETSDSESVPKNGQVQTPLSYLPRVITEARTSTFVLSSPRTCKPFEANQRWLLGTLDTTRYIRQQKGCTSSFGCVPTCSASLSLRLSPVPGATAENSAKASDCRTRIGSCNRCHMRRLRARRQAGFSLAWTTGFARSLNESFQGAPIDPCDAESIAAECRLCSPRSPRHPPPSAT